MIIEKAREFNIPLYMAFIDFKKALDSVVRHTALYEIMKKMGVSEQIISPLRKLYQNQEAVIRVESELSELRKECDRDVQSPLSVLISTWKK